jgi:hypothetical protein
MNWIAKALSKDRDKEVSYKQVRNRIGKLVERGFLEKWTICPRPMMRMTYYRIPLREEMREYIFEKSR